MHQLQSDWPPGTDVEIFEKNLRALADAQPELAYRLCQSVVGGHLEEQADGATIYELYGARTLLDLDPGTVEPLVQQALARSSEQSRVLLFGIGLGEIATRLLQEDGARVVAWDRDPWMIRLFLGREDVAMAICEGRLRLAMGADLLAVLADPTIEARIEHPVFAKLYSRELDWTSGVKDQRVLLCAGELYVDSLGRALEDEGFSVWTFEIERLSEEELDYTVHAIEPRAVAGINYCEGLAEFTDKHGIQLMVWEIDPFTHSPKRPQSSTAHSRFFSYRAGNVTEMLDLGFEHAEHMPLAADTELRRPLELTGQEREHYQCAVSFVGNSMYANAQEFRRQFVCDFTAWAEVSGNSVNAVEMLNVILAVQRHSFSTFTIPETLEATAPDFRLWCQLHRKERDPLILLGELAASEKRFEYLNGLTEFGLNVWGDDGWQSDPALANCYRGKASHVHDLTRIYCASTINLDIGRIYQNDIVTMRVFDILACGGFALVQHNQSLSELFDVGVELESYRCFEECRDKVEYYLKNPEQARKIAERGLAAVSARHTFSHRVRHMIESFEAKPSASNLRLVI